MAGMFRYLMVHLGQEGRRDGKILAVLSLVSPVVDIFSLSVLVFIINKVVRENQASAKLIVFTICMAGVSVLKCFFELYHNKLSNCFVYDGAQKLSMRVYEMLIKEDLMAHNQKDTMQALAMIRQDTTVCVQAMVSYIAVWVNGITLLGYTVILIYSSRWIGLASSGALVLSMVLVYRRNRIQMKAYGERSRAYAIQANAQVTISYGSFKEMKIDDRSDFVLQKYHDASIGYAKVQGEYQYKSSSLGVVLRNSVMGFMFLVLAVILLVSSELAAFLAPMVVYVMAISRMLPVSHNILNGLNSIEFAKKPYESLRDAIAKYAEIKEEEKQLENIRRKKLTFQKGLSVRNLTFGYREDRKIFEDASIDIPVGRSIAIIGASGAGKTTFLDLILGLLKPWEGNIFYDDYDIVTHSDQDGSCVASIGQLVSYIPQTVYLNGETVRNNVAFFSEESDIDDVRVEDCLKCAQIWEDVMEMPDGIHTLIGENGTAISGGQRQRIALARALYKDFELLVMDEATAALDMDTEKAVIDSIRQVKGNKTLLMVTHHMSLANECDVLYKIENKKIVRVRGC